MDINPASVSPIDPVCLFHGKRRSEHDCLYCCLCFKDLTIEECHIREDGLREDVCNECAEYEHKKVMEIVEREMKELLDNPPE